MPVRSARQYGLMQAAAHGHARSGGPSQAVAKEFLSKTPAKDRSRYARALAHRRRKRRPHTLIGAS